MTGAARKKDVEKEFNSTTDRLGSFRGQAEDSLNFMARIICDDIYQTQMLKTSIFEYMPCIICSDARPRATVDGTCR